MIGDEYFQLRAELRNALSSLLALAHDLHLAPEVFEELHGLHEDLREPFLFVVIGDVRAGKSSLLNALFGREFSRADMPPAADKLYVLKFGEEKQDVAITEMVTECYRHADFLRDFNIVDTPDTTTLIAEHETIIERFLPRADLILFVFSVTSPWAAGPWELLKYIQKQWVRHAVFVLQQADLRTPQEVEAILNHLREAVREKLGDDRAPAFAVSAKQAFFAKTEATDRAGMLVQSGFDKLEDCISDKITRSESRLERLRTVCSAGESWLADFTTYVRDVFKILQADNQLFTEAAGTLTERREQSLRQVDSLRLSFVRTYEQAQERAEESLRKNLSWGRTMQSIFGKPKWETEFHDRFDQPLQESLHRQIANSIELIEHELRTMWEQMRSTLRGTSFREKVEELTPPDFTRERQTFFKKTGLVLMQKIASEDIEKGLGGKFSKAAIWLRIPAIILMLGICVTAGVAFAMPQMTEIAGAATIAIALPGVFIATAKRQRVLKEFREQMEHRREELLAPIDDHLRHMVMMFHQQIAHGCQPLHASCLAQIKIYEPILGAVKQTGNRFSKVAGALNLAQPDSGQHP